LILEHVGELLPGLHWDLEITALLIRPQEMLS
jgi:hypothetical protein